MDNGQVHRGGAFSKKRQTVGLHSADHKESLTYGSYGKLIRDASLDMDASHLDDSTGERELIMDAAWKRIQQNTFTRWVNEHLKNAGCRLDNLETDLSDGLLLIQLVQVLSGKKVGRFTKKPNFRSQQLENVSVALKFLESVEGVRLVNIDSTDIVDKRLKLILGLIWTLILHYSISVPMWDEEDENANNMQNGKLPNKETPKQRLLGWIQSKIPEVGVKNFTHDWSDGIALGALVDAVAPGSNPEWRNWNPQQALRNNTEAMGKADEYLGIPQLITPDEMTHPDKDELSVMTYLSQYPSARLRPEALRPKKVIPIKQEPVTPPKTPSPRKHSPKPPPIRTARAYGLGLQRHGVVSKQTTQFEAEPLDQQAGKLFASVRGPSGTVPVDQMWDPARCVYVLNYHPFEGGPHTVTLEFENRPVQGSPFTVDVMQPKAIINLVKAYGPGLEPGVVVDRPTHFDISTNGAGGRGEVDVVIVDPDGEQDTVAPTVRMTSDGTYNCSYCPKRPGLHSVNVFYDSQPVSSSPYAVKVKPVYEVSKVRAWGRGLQAKGVRVADKAEFDVFYSDAGKGNPSATVTGPNGKNVYVHEKVMDDGKTHYVYEPVTVGTHTVNVLFSGDPVSSSPYEYKSRPGNHRSLKDILESSYPDLYPGYGRIAAANYYPYSNGYYPTFPAAVVTSAKSMSNVAEVESPRPSRRDTHEYSMDYGSRTLGRQPARGILKQRSMSGSRDQPMVEEAAKKKRSKSQVVIAVKKLTKPFYSFAKFRPSYRQNVYVGPEIFSKIRAFGPGLEGGVVNLPCDFTVETNGQSGNLGFEIAGPSPAKIVCQDNGDGSAELTYTPEKEGDYVLHILCNEEDIPNSPYMVHIYPYKDLRPSQVKCSGPGLQRFGVKRGEQTRFTVDARGAGDGFLKIDAIDREYEVVPINVWKQGQADMYECTYTPLASNRHTVIISYGGVAVAGSPFRVNVEEPIDPAKVRIHGPGVEAGLKSQQPTHFIIDAKQAGPGEVEVTLTDEQNNEVDVALLDNHDGSFTVKYTAPRPGFYQMRVVFAGTEIPGSPIRIHVQPHLDVGGIRVEGLDNRVFVECASEFTIDARRVSSLGGDKITCYMLCPTGDKLLCPVIDNFDGTFIIPFTPFEEGAYHFQAEYENIALHQNPITVYALRGSDPSMCKAFGPGLTGGLVGQTAFFTVQTKGAGTGNLGLFMEGPEEARMTCRDNRDGSCDVEYMAMLPGKYDIDIKYDDQHIPGSPFQVYIDYPVDASVVKCSGPGLDPQNVRAGVPLTFSIDASKSGYSTLNVDVEADNNEATRRTEIRELTNNKYDVTYWTPSDGSLFSLNVMYANKHVPMSPFRMRALPTVEAQKVKLLGTLFPAVGSMHSIVTVPASLPTTFTVDTRNAGYSQLEVVILDPWDIPVKVVVSNKGEGMYDVTFIPDELGTYSIRLKYGGQDVLRAPYRVKAIEVGNAARCVILDGKRDRLRSGEEYCISVDAVAAGRGRVTCRIVQAVIGATPLAVDIDESSTGVFNIYYRPDAIDRYRACVKFGGTVIPDGEWSFKAESPDSEEKIVLQRGVEYISNGYAPSEGLPVELWNLPLEEGLLAHQLGGRVIMPSKQHDVPIIKENADGTVTVKYQPKVTGLHEMQITHNGVNVNGSPFQFHVDSIREGYVSAYGPGLSFGTAGESATFTVCAKEVGSGGLSISVDGPAKAEIKTHDNQDGTCAVSWNPPAPGEYQIHIKFDNKEITGSPFCAKIAGEGRKRAHISVSSTSEVSLKISEDLTGLSASIKSPTGIEEPCFIRKLDEGHLGVSFTPRETGEHLVSVKKKGTLLPGSPYRIQVGAKEIGDASKVKVTGPGLETAVAQQKNEFTVDSKNAGFGGLSISVEGPSKCQLECKNNKEGACSIVYTPTEPGLYVLGVKFADHHVNGSPFTVKCTGQGVGTVSEKVSKTRNAPATVCEGQPCEMHVKIPNTSPMDMQAKVMTPEGKVEDVDLRDVGECQYLIAFVPNEAGLHTISVLNKGQHVSGSPFQFTVGPFSEGGSHKVRAGGAGLVRGEVNIPSAFNIYTREAGSGNLSVAIEGPSKPKIDWKDHKDGNCWLSYLVTKPGDYAVSVKFNDVHIPDSPFKVFVSPSSGEARKLEVAAFPNRGLQTGKPCTFTVLTHKAVGQLDAKVITPSGGEDDCFISPIDDEGESYAVRFIPRESGNYYVHVKLDGTHMRDSPFRLRVGGREEVDPTAVTAGGLGLRKGETGHKCEYIINTCNAGEGQLQVSIDGPSKVTLDAYEVDVGYKVRYTPMAPGDYFMTIKFNGVHVPGSPFKVNVTGKTLGGSGYNESSTVNIQAVSKSAVATPQAPKLKGDASQVDAKGMGIKRAYLNRQNHFTVDCSKAGQDLLFVSLMTPKGPSDEVYVKHMGRGNYTVNYKVTQKGATYIYIKYGDEHIPGSPFLIEI